MEDTIIERKYICDRETYLRAKEQQKKFGPNADNRKEIEEYYKQDREWWNSKPEQRFGTVYSEWRLKTPKKPICLSDKSEVRAHNIVYGLMKGKAYLQIEKKYRKDNEPKIECIDKFIEEYNLLPEDIHEKLSLGYKNE